MSGGIEVKICGLCRPMDVAAAGRAGADYVGVVLVAGGPRSRTVPQAQEVLAATAAAAAAASSSPRRVGVFADPEPEQLLAAVDALGLDVVQLHGAEPPGLLAGLRQERRELRVWKALRVRDAESFRDGVARYGEVADALLLDGWSSRAAGGTGVVFPWSDVAELRHLIPAGVRLIVAGGLTPATVAEAIRILRPDGVDVSSGVESAPGLKDPNRIAEFVQRARSAA